MSLEYGLCPGSESFKKLVKKLENPDVTYQNSVKRLARDHFNVKAIIQDILSCKDSMSTLNMLNEKGRSILQRMRNELDNLEMHGREMGDQTCVVEVAAQRQQMACLLKEFKDSNIISMFAIEKSQRENLLETPKKEEPGVKKRKNVNKDGLLKKSLDITDQLLSISRQLADTTQRSQDTLDNLVSSSSTVHGTQSELEVTAGSITQSSKLLKKYGRREFTDKVIMFFAFLFFLAVCLYIVQKRLF